MKVIRTKTRVMEPYLLQKIVSWAKTGKVLQTTASEYPSAALTHNKQNTAATFPRIELGPGTEA